MRVNDITQSEDGSWWIHIHRQKTGTLSSVRLLDTTQLYAKVTDRKVDEDMKRLKAAGMDRTPGLYEEEVIVRKRRRKFGYQLSDNKETTL